MLSESSRSSLWNEVGSGTGRIATGNGLKGKRHRRTSSFNVVYRFKLWFWCHRSPLLHTQLGTSSCLHFRLYPLDVCTVTRSTWEAVANQKDFVCSTILSFWVKISATSLQL